MLLFGIELNEGYFYNVLDNILKNSFEAYERNGIERPKPCSFNSGRLQ